MDFRKSETALAATKGRALDHIGFEVKGLEAFCKKLQAEGYTLEVPYREMPQLDGLTTVFLVVFGGSSFASTTCAMPVSSRITTNCTFFWSRIAFTQPRIVTCSPIFPGSSFISVRSTPGTLSETY